MALLQSLNDANGPKAKRRKLDNDPTTSKDEGAPSDNSDDEVEEKDVDRVDEEAEEDNADIEEQPDEDSEDEGDSTDPFDVHFAHPNDDLVAKRVTALKKGDWATKRALMRNWRATVMYPNSDVGSEIPKPLARLDGTKLKQKLKETASSKIGSLSPIQQNLGSLLFDYRDILHCDRTARNAEQMRQLTCLHALNHVFK